LLFLGRTQLERNFSFPFAFFTRPCHFAFLSHLFILQLDKVKCTSTRATAAHGLVVMVRDWDWDRGLGVAIAIAIAIGAAMFCHVHVHVWCVLCGMAARQEVRSPNAK